MRCDDREQLEQNALSGTVPDRGDIRDECMLRPHALLGARSWRDRDSDDPTTIQPSTDHDDYFASGLGRIWNFTTFGNVPLPPSWCQGA